MKVHGVTVVLYNTRRRNKRVGTLSSKYSLRLTVPLKVKSVVLPSPRKMERLAKLFLDSSYKEPYRRIDGAVDLLFVIKSGTHPEKRAAFLGAVCANIRVVPKLGR